MLRLFVIRPHGLLIAPAGIGMLVAGLVMRDHRGEASRTRDRARFTEPAYRVTISLTRPGRTALLGLAFENYPA
jgi:hypothetical protein